MRRFKTLLFAAILGFSALTGCDINGEPTYTGFSFVDEKMNNYIVGEKFADYIENGGLTVYRDKSDGTKDIYYYHNEETGRNRYAVSLNNGANISRGFTTAGSYNVTIRFNGASDLSYTIKVNEEGGEIDPPEPTVSVTDVSLNKTSLTLEKGQSETLTATVSPNNASNKNVTWSSSNTSVATVSNGIVTAISKGNAIITVKTNDGNKTATCSITVVEGEQPVEGDTFVTSFKSNSDNGSNQLSIANIYDEITSGEDNFTVSYVTRVFAGKNGLKFGNSNDGGILTLISSSTIKGLDCNQIILTVSQYSSETCTFELFANDSSVASGSSTSNTITADFDTPISLESIKITSSKRAYLSKITVVCQPSIPVDPETISIPSTENVNVGTSKTLTLTYLPSDANQNKEVTWRSSNSNIVAVNNGVITGVAEGTATVKAKLNLNDYEVSCTVTVSTIKVTSVSLSNTTKTLNLNATFKLTATVLPSDATNKNVSWSSNKTNIATVDQNGTVTAKAVGEAVITVTTADQNKTATCTINVEEKQLSAWTIMIYMCGSSLEYDEGERYVTEKGETYQVEGFGTSDLEEILSANIPENPTNANDKINIIIQTGGISTDGKWYLNSSYMDNAQSISATKTQRWEVRGNKLHLVKTNNTKIMSSQSEFTSFLNWGLDNYEANRYAVIMWDHGSGIAGCLNDDASNEYLKNSDVAKSCESALNAHDNVDKFDFIAYDCCLMGCADIASVNASYFNYMVASQESEYAGGYDYDEWLKVIKNNPTTVTTDKVCDTIAQTFVQEQCYDYRDCQDCLQTNAVYDLSKMDQLTTDFNSFSASLQLNTQDKFDNMCINVFKKALGFGIDSYGSLYGLCDFADLIKKLSTKYSVSYGNLINDINSVVVHNYYCTEYGTTKPCGMNGFVAYAYNTTGKYGMQVSEADYTGTYSTSFSNWQTMNLSFGTFYD